MADSDLTIVILRNIQAELVAFRENFAAINDRFDSVDKGFIEVNHRVDSLRDQMLHQFAQNERRISNLEDIAIGTASALGVETQALRHRTIRYEGEIAELKARVSDLETIVKGKPTP